ncbi:MAG: hypothetical protein IH898_11470 [Planctomycetes bacterium]|nr:hypothetical protein [Planctomycetota bacterium]
MPFDSLTDDPVLQRIIAAGLFGGSTNELIKRLQARFAAEGIEINYPVRKLVYDGAPPPGLSRGVPVSA